MESCPGIAGQDSRNSSLDVIQQCRNRNDDHGDVSVIFCDDQSGTRIPQKSFPAGDANDCGNFPRRGRTISHCITPVSVKKV